jgi:hypothetical protein
MKHTDAPTISQGLKRYMRTCSTSGLASVRARGEQLASMSKGERMAAYKAEFGSNWAGNSAPTAPKGGSMSIEAAVEALRAAGIEVNLPTESVVEDAPSGRTFKKGTRFSFEAQNGNVREHTVLRVKDGRAYTDQGQDFHIEKALNGYAADRVVIL